MLAEQTACGGRQFAVRLLLDQMAIERGRSTDRLAGVVNQEVEPRKRFAQVGRQPLDGRRLAQVEAVDLQPVRWLLTRCESLTLTLWPMTFCLNAF